MEKGSEKKLKNLNVVVASHIFATGPALDLEEFLKNKVKSLLFLGHPFSYRKKTNSFYRLYKKGKLTRERRVFGWKLPEVLFYVRDAFYTLWWMVTLVGKTDLYIGSDNFLAFLGIILKRLGKVDEVILYTIDYVPQRFNNPVLNFLYHYFDKQCLSNCKVVWNVSPRIAQARAKFRGLKPEDYVPQIVVPLGVWHDRVPKIPHDKKNRLQVIYMGHLLEKQGVDLVIGAMADVFKKISGAKLVVIGTGPFERKLKNLARKLGVTKNVIFMGYIKDHREVERKLAKAAVAVAMYKPIPDSFTYFSDPGKIKNYLSAGLPVVLTDVPKIAKELERKKAGFICDYDEVKLAKLLTRLLSDEKLLRQYSRNAVALAERFDWNKVFTQALEESL